MNDLVTWLYAQLAGVERENAAKIRAFRSDWVPRDIEAKRRILDAWPDPFGNWTASQAEAARMLKERVVRLLALPYADRPGYDESWRP
jgi:hypothetical protein